MGVIQACLGAFGLGDRGKAARLARLAEQTVIRMEALLSTLDKQDPDRPLIESHLERRKKQLQRYAMLARGKTDLGEQISPTLRHYAIWRTSMEKELSMFTASTASLAWYIRAIRQD